MGNFTTLVLANVAGAAGLALLTLVACRFARRAEFVHKAWLVVFLKLVAPSLLVLPVLPVLSHELPTVETTSEPVPRALAVEAVPNHVESVNAVSHGTSDPLLLPDTDRSDANLANPPAPLIPPVNGTGVGDWLLTIWAAGAIGYWFLVLIAVVQFHRRMRAAAIGDDDTANLVERVATRLGLLQFPRIEFSPERVSPMVWAALAKPRLIVPHELWGRLSDPQRETILAHELAHVARRDHWVRRLEVLILGCYWWCPIAWFARARLRQAEEACCDQRVLQAYPELAQAYAEALIETAMFVARPEWAPLASGGSARAGELKRRVNMILSNRPNRTVRRPIAATMIVIAVALLSLRPGFSQVASSTNPDPLQSTPQPAPPLDQIPLTPVPDIRPARTLLSTIGQPAQAPNATLTHRTDAQTQSLRDEIEMLEAQRTTKQAQLMVAKVSVDAAQRKYETLKDSGTGPKTEVNQADDERHIAAAKLKVQEAELSEHEVKIKQAKRKLESASTAPQLARFSYPPAVSVPGNSAFPTMNYPAQTALTQPAPNVADPAASVPKANLDTIQAQLNKLASDQKSLQAQLKKATDEYNQLRMQNQRLDVQRLQLEKLIGGFKVKPGQDTPPPKE